MTCDAVISIISALIGGGLTLLGVLITIFFENKNRNREIKLAHKPLFYVINPKQDYDFKNAVDYHFFKSHDIFYNGKLQFILKNTDKAIMIMNYLSINGIKYYPNNGNVVDKNTVFNIFVHSSSNPLSDGSNEILLNISDTLDNNYTYNLDYSLSDETITGYHEIIKDKK